MDLLAGFQEQAFLVKKKKNFIYFSYKYRIKSIYGINVNQTNLSNYSDFFHEL